MLVPIDLPPGVFRNGTRYQTRGRWYDCNLIRWVDGMMRPIGGWTRMTTNPMSNKTRSLYAWRTNSGGRWLAIGTASQLLVTRADGTIYDVTPTGFLVGGDDAIEQLGYGGGLYGLANYGVARPGGTFLPPATWQFDAWGDQLVGCSRTDGKIYQWTLNSGVPASQIAGSPIGCLGLVVSDERHLITFGANANRKLVKWSAKENNTLWTPAADNEAGSFELVTEGEYVKAVRMKGQILVCTDTDAHIMNYIGQPFIYRRERIGKECGLLGPNAIIVAGSAAYWMSDKKFWFFNGGAVQSLPCEVADYVFTDINTVQGTKIAAGHNSAFGEVWWFYPSANSTENDRYVVYNYLENHWTIGRLSRSAWIDRGVFPQAIAAGTDNHLYRHEEGLLDAGASRFSQIYAESGALELDNGDLVGQVNQIIPDEKTQGQLEASFTTKFTPTGGEYEFGPYVVRSDGYTDTRFSGRQIVMRVEPVADTDFRMGRFRLDIATSGQR